ncbi:molybdopterin molybdotransferase MoeA [Paracoccus sp. Z118]|uniref:molybdopterin molybdotransferase MoeA n=1 Tax=Paracoccus sp. Z118 TaxID=2851017 RepID=UPI001C2CA463|nr:gephyrin-like molybdotransferase Glp [Paracoccus sp. Z118]MBV0891007.1 molybdopterin molybdotransferase MoeA [Paracoccus sp. Z118]
MITVDEALARVLALAPKPEGEEISIADALGRVLLKPAVSRMTQPPFDASAMDGYAVRSADLPGPLQVVGEVAAGGVWTGSVLPGTALRIFTGAPVPPGFDRVVMQEHATRDGDLITVAAGATGPHIRLRGNDFSESDSLPAGRRLGAADLGLLAAMNLPRITVARAPTVAVIAGGDELVTPGTPPAAGQIISSNDLVVAALAQQAGAEVRIMPLARDTQESLTAILTDAADADVIVTIGGASVGDHDLVGRAATGLGIEQAFYKVAMRPGKPLLAGRLGGAAMLGLPGNPVSATVCAILFLQPLIRHMQGLPGVHRLRHGVLGRDLPAEGNRQHYLRASLEDGPDGSVVTPFPDQDSARLKLMAEAGALLVRPAGDSARRAGERVMFLPLRGAD